jgi:hypothetical protein
MLELKRLAQVSSLMILAVAVGGSEAFARNACMPAPDAQAMIIDLERQVVELRAALRSHSSRKGGTSSLEAIAACTTLDRSGGQISVGTRCRTSKGLVYERVRKDGFGEAWRGPDGLIWSGGSNQEVAYSEANAACARMGGRLPALQNFKTHYAMGLNEVFDIPADYSKGWSTPDFWTTTLDRNSFAMTSVTARLVREDNPYNYHSTFQTGTVPMDPRNTVHFVCIAQSHDN